MFIWHNINELKNKQRNNSVFINVFPPLLNFNNVVFLCPELPILLISRMFPVGPQNLNGDKALSGNITEKAATFLFHDILCNF